jgi:quinol monooxygenase YgiN
MAQTLHIVAHVTARAGEEKKVREMLEKLIEPTRSEPGCRNYELFVNKEKPGDYVFVEEYDDDAAFDAHMASKHVTAAVTEVVPLLASLPDIRRYVKLG